LDHIEECPLTHLPVYIGGNAVPYEVNAMTDSGATPGSMDASGRHPRRHRPERSRPVDAVCPGSGRQTGARLILLHAIATAAAMSVDAVGMPYYDPSAALDFAEKELKPWCDAASRQQHSCDGLVREGHATQQIATAARQFQADRILLGTRSRSRLGKILLGSVAEQVLRSVNLPVFTVGPEAHLPVKESAS
jgi:nucleotide-binding universal stress UspA family protein